MASIRDLEIAREVLYQRAKRGPQGTGGLVSGPDPYILIDRRIENRKILAARRMRRELGRVG